MFCAIGNFDRVVQLVTEMHQVKRTPDEYTYSIIINSCMIAGKYELAYSMYNDLLKSGTRIGMQLYTILIRMFCSISDLSNAEKVFETMVDSKIKLDSQVFNVFMNGCIKMGELDKAESIYNIAGPSLQKDSYLQTTMIHLHCLRGNLEKAISQFNNMIRSNIKPNDITFTALLEGCKDRNDIPYFKKIIQLLNESNIERSVILYNMIISKCFDLGQFLQKHLTCLKI